MKILTFAKLPARWRPDLGGLPAGREGWISSVRELADLSGVSLPQTRRFLATYEELGFLERGTQGIRLCRTLELLSSWSIQVASQFGQRVPARFNGTRESWLRSVRNRGAFDATNSSGGAPQSTRLVLGFHEAARLWELGEVVGAPISVYSTSPLKAVFDRLDLEPTSHESATVWLHRPRFPVSLRIGVSTNPKVDAPDQRIPVTDVVQCFIDLLHCPVRGAEAAERIRRDVFGEFD